MKKIITIELDGVLNLYKGNYVEDKGLLKYISSVTNLKNNKTYIYVDNRAVTFRGDYDILLDEIDRFIPRW